MLPRKTQIATDATRITAANAAPKRIFDFFAAGCWRAGVGLLLFSRELLFFLDLRLAIAPAIFLRLRSPELGRIRWVELLVYTLTRPTTEHGFPPVGSGHPPRGAGEHALARYPIGLSGHHSVRRGSDDCHGCLQISQDRVDQDRLSQPGDGDDGRRPRRRNSGRRTRNRALQAASPVQPRLTLPVVRRRLAADDRSERRRARDGRERSYRAAL